MDIISPATQTNWVLKALTFTGFGTPTQQAFYARRDGPDLLIRGHVTAGTMTATEARVTLPDSLTTVSTINANNELCGSGVNNAVAAQVFHVLAQPSKTYVVFSLCNGGAAAGLTPRNGNALLNNGDQFSFWFRVPVVGWEL